MRRFLLAILGLVTAIPVSAQGYHLTDSGWSCAGFLLCGTGQNLITYLTGNIIGGVSMFIIPLAVVVFFYGAIRMVTSQGQEGKEAGKKALIYAALGLVAALLTGAIIQFVYDYIYFVAG